MAISPARAAPLPATASKVITFDDGDRTGGGVLGVYQPGVVVTSQGATFNPAPEGLGFAWFGTIRQLSKSGDTITVAIPVVRTFDIKPLRDTTAQPLIPYDAASGAPTTPPIKLQAGQWQTITLPPATPQIGDQTLVRVGSGFYLDNIAYDTVAYTVKEVAPGMAPAALAPFHAPKKAIAAGGLLLVILVAAVIWLWRRRR